MIEGLRCTRESPSLLMPDPSLERTDAGSAEGDALLEARFQAPFDVPIGSDGSAYVVDVINLTVSKITGAGASASVKLIAFDLTEPRGVAVDANGNVYGA